MTNALPFLVLAVMASMCTSIHLDPADGGYMQVLVGIDSSVSVNIDILNNLRVLFRKASQFLFEATRGKFYFKEVLISVPKNWPRTVQRELVWGSQFRDAQFQIIPRLRELGILASTATASSPVRIPAVFLASLNGTTTTIYGKPEYHLVHHWAIHRYKVYSESADDPRKKFYCSPKPNGAEMKAVRCSDLISYNVTNGTGGVCPDMNSCSTSPYSCDVTYYQGPDRAAESVMFLPYLEGVKLFCDQDTHNPLGNNKHNRVYKGLSTWEVIMKHKDYLKLAKLPANRTIHTTFREQQEIEDTGSRMVFVLDVSHSMRQFGRMDYLKSAVQNIIRYSIYDGEIVGLVSFHAACKVEHPLASLNNNTRDALAAAVRELKYGAGTSIGCGLQLAVKELEFNNTSSVGSTIILVTDGEENRDPSIDDVLPGLTRKSIKVHTYALGPEASTKLEQIADETDGTAYYFGDFQNNTIAALGSAFLVSVTSHLDTINHPIILLDKTASFRTAEEFPFTVPQELGANTKISITSLSVQKFDFYVKDANGQNCTDCNKEIGDQLEIIHIPETEATTLWTLVLIPQAGTVSNVTVTVQSTQRDPSVHPIRAQSFVKEDKSKNQVTIYSRVSKGDRGVLRAVVIATVTLPGLSGTTFLHLKDNGLGADETRNDGEYSAYFSHLVGQGRYSVRTDVTTKEDTLLTPPRSTAMPGRLRAGLLEPGEEPEQAVQEISAEQPEGADINMVVYAGAVNILRNITQKDLNPADVRDLRVDSVTVDGKNITATLSWTCMGAHLDSGRADHTDLRASSDPRVLLRKFEKATQISTENLLEGTLVPLDPLKIQTVRIRIPQELVSRTGGTPGSVFLALRTNNSRLQVSAVSNFVQLDWDTSSGGSVVDPTEAHPPPAVRTTASPRTVAPAATTPYTPSTPPAELKGQDEKSSSGLLLGAVLVAVVAVVVAVALYALMSQSGVVGAAGSHDDAESEDDESTVAW
ncbi:calcium-activated chloride channel regulator 1 [Ixodes scapularis]|uniref:calcium-activated chloride channel regulator 1 n=1 Tax=Ixodes scapularis TaxID=6945 RepID=UPI001A9D4FEA|nr:calcium-activated chloride channel regulator 1 [Ixodes scapularis]